jgi:hypothetical protein
LKCPRVKLAFPTGFEPVFSAPFTMTEVEAPLGYGNVVVKRIAEKRPMSRFVLYN